VTPLQKAFDVFDRCPATKVLVAVSGGKDSLCTLDLAVRRYGAANVTGFLMTLVPGIECEWEPVRRLERRYGIRVIGVPHYDLGRLLRLGTYREPREEYDKLPWLKQVDVERAVRTQTGLEWICWGLKATDSTQRNALLKQCRGVEATSRRLHPIWAFRKQDVYGYLHVRKLPVPSITGGGTISGGITLTASCLLWLRDKCPHREHGGASRCYAKMLDVFPYAGVAIYRHEVLKVDPIADVKARFRKKKTHGEEAPPGAARAQSETREGS
jgi:3'-phosphoadenosine 5'-phosphosulfate sulfotransferase (PAPS reductase)/FAD synthetase